MLTNHTTTSNQFQVDHEPIYHSTILNIKMLLICASAYLNTTTRARICLIGEIRTSDNFLLLKYKARNIMHVPVRPNDNAHILSSVLSLLCVCVCVCLIDNFNS